MCDQPRVNQAAIDQAARDLYAAYRLCSACHQPVALADQLRFTCPHCGAIILPGPDMTPERGREMLTTLQTRRQALGLEMPSPAE